MPTYEYECLKCGHKFEKFQSMTDDPVKRCPKCRCKVRRMFGTGAGIIFKGAGFYETDYRSKSYSEGASKEKSESTAAKGDTKKDTKNDSSVGSKKTSTAGKEE